MRREGRGDPTGFSLKPGPAMILYRTIDFGTGPFYAGRDLDVDFSYFAVRRFFDVYPCASPDVSRFAGQDFPPCASVSSVDLSPVTVVSSG